MAVEIRVPEYDEWPDVYRADTRVFGVSATPDDIEQARRVHELDRFRVAFEKGKVVGAAGSYALEVTVPGGASVPMGGLTWVSTAATHRRQGLMRRVVGAVHDDVDARGERLVTLFAAEGSIYERLDYGVSTRVALNTIAPRLTRMRDEYRSAPGAVEYLEGDEVVPAISPIWDRFRRLRAGECERTPEAQAFLFDHRNQPFGSQTPMHYLGHPDGYAAYRMEDHWNDGHPAHVLHVTELAAVTPEAHAALWQTLLGVDLVGEIRTFNLAPDDPLPFLLENPRAVRTREVNDGVWVNVRDIPACFGARTYRTSDRIVVEVDGKRWAIEGGPAGASCTAVKTRADLVTTHAWFSALLYGGVLPSALVAGRRMTARDADVLARADLFFTTSLAPHCQERY